MQPTPHPEAQPKERTVKNIFTFQVRAMPILLGWAGGSILAGLLWQRERDPWFKGFGGQFIGWGIINGLIALFGLRGAQKNAARFTSGEISLEEHTRQTNQFRNLVAINTALDVGYIAAGAWLAGSKNSPDPQRKGMGWGIILQGAFLFVWDLLLTLLVMQRPPAHDA